MTDTTSETDSLDKLVTLVMGMVGLTMVLHGVGRLSGIIPAEPAPAWAFIAIGLSVITVVTIE